MTTDMIPKTATVIAGQLPSLAKALSVARDRCRAASKDATNTFHKYEYASAEEVIATAVDALDGSGLAVIPVSERMVILATSPQVTYALDRTLLLAHASGETCPIEVSGWPIIPERGRPLDKAYATALTSSLAYKLRDLLQMPRGNQFDDDVSAADDRQTPVVVPHPQQQTQQAAKAQPAVSPEPPKQIGNRILDRALAFQGRLMDAGLCEDGQLFDFLEDTLGQGWVTESPEEIGKTCKFFEQQQRQRQTIEQNA